MIFSLQKKDIADKLQHLLNVVSSKTNMLVLSNFRLDADATSSTLTITATDLNITTIVKISANVIENGSVLVSAKRLSEIVNSLDDANINFSIKDDYFYIECENSSFKINHLEADLFPDIYLIENDNQYDINALAFKKLIQNTTFCVAPDAIQSICNGVYIKIEDNLITMAGTDTKRIGEAKLTTDFTVAEPYEIVVPPRALSFIDKNINQDADLIAIKYDDKKISFYLKNILVISNKYEGKFPGYTVAFKNPPETTLMLDKNKLKDAIRRVALMSEDEDKLLKISMNKNYVLVETYVSEHGNAEVKIDGVSYDGEDAVFCLNSRLLSGLVNAIESEEVIIKMRSNIEPIWLLNNADLGNLDIRFIVMPMRMDNRDRH